MKNLNHGTLHVRLLLTISLSMSLASAFSQDYIGLPESGGKWVNSFYEVDWIYQNPIPSLVLVATVSYCTAGIDTVINTENYTRIDTCLSGGYRGAFRNYEGKVYYVPKDSTAEYLLYDYSLMPGDTAFNVYCEPYYGEPTVFEFLVCSYIDYIMVAGESRKHVYMNGASATWIEGIGQDMGLFQEWWANVSNYKVELHCMSWNDEALFPEYFQGPCELAMDTDEPQTGNHEFSLYPNPASTTLHFHLPGGTLTRASLHDMQGRQVLEVRLKPSAPALDVSTLPKGMYLLRANCLNGAVYTQKLIVQ